MPPLLPVLKAQREREAFVRRLYRNPFFLIYAVCLVLGKAYMGDLNEHEGGYFNSLHRPMSIQAFLWILTIIAAMIFGIVTAALSH